MTFWDLKFSRNVAFIDENRKEPITYQDLQELINIVKKSFNDKAKTLGFVFCKNNAETLIGYLAALQSRQAAFLLNAELNVELKQKLLDIYQPDWVWVPQGIEGVEKYETVIQLWGYELKMRSGGAGSPDIYPELAVLLSTSGTTGSPKLVRLSYKNVQANAESIAEYLKLTSNERPITSLPLEYSYGLSVVNSHLHAGATILLTDKGIMTKDFWNFFKEWQATSIAGVPYIYEMLYRLGLHKMNLPSLRTMTQAGGRLKDKFQQFFGEFARQNNLKFFVMYGQTEATARISYVPPEKLLQKIGSIGIAIPGGHLQIDESTQELIYNGPNVMLGYAESREDLAKGDEQHGRLETGDLACQDEDGFFYIVGRKKRFIKLFGLRINLDEVEHSIESKFGVTCYCLGRDDADLLIALLDGTRQDEIRQFVADYYKLHPTALTVTVITEVPLLSTGKVDYKALGEALKSDL